MLNRRQVLATATASAAFATVGSAFAESSKMGHKERVDRALRGQELDYPPFTLWHHYNKPTAREEAKALLNFHRSYGTDIVKVMNDFDYPRSTSGRWYDLKATASPYPDQLETLEFVRDSLDGSAYFIDTLYGPYFTALLLFAKSPEFGGKHISEKTAGPAVESLKAFQRENPQAWHDMMEVITESTINHIRKSKEIGAAGALVSVMNATTHANSVADYERFSRPYDKRIISSLADSKLTMLHLHFLEAPFLKQFQDFNTPVINYSVKNSGISISDVRKVYSQAIAGGIDEVDYPQLSVEEMRRQWITAREQAGNKYIITPGCSVPDSTPPVATARLRQSILA